MSRMCQIKASAGSGKTFTLTSRYMRLMADCLGGVFGKHAPCIRSGKGTGSRINDILAVTFTNAAVGEIRERVINSLKKASLGLIKVPGLDKDRASLCLDALLDDMDQLNVRTIDSLLHHITRSAALSLGLNPDFEPAFEASEALAPYLDKFMEQAFLGDPEKVDAIRAAVGKFLEHSQWGKVKPLLLGKPLARELEGLLEDVLLSAESSPYPEKEKVSEAMKTWQVQTTNDARRLLTAIEALNQKNNGQVLKLYKQSQDFLEAWAEGEGANKDPKDWDFMSNVLKKGQGKFDPGPFEAIFASLRENYTAFKACSEHLKYAGILELARGIVEDFRMDLAHAKTLPSLLIPPLASRALSMDDGICDALCRLGSRLDHFMLDEFQDTSGSQWQGIRPLVAEALSRNGSLTWVGDIKQSIFMWRNARPELFDSIAQDQELACMVEKVQKKRLPYNRRSARKIVEFNNALFGQLNKPEFARELLSVIEPLLGEKQELIASINAAFAGASQDLAKTADPGGMVTVKGIAQGGKDKESFWLNFKGELLKFLKARMSDGVSPSDILILVRANEDAEFLSACLAEAGLPVITENALLLQGESLIQEAVALLEFMADPDNEIALQTVLCGEAFLDHPSAAGYEVDDMHSLAFSKGEKRLARHFRDTLPELWEALLKPFSAVSTLMPPYDMVKEWYRRMDLERRYPERKIFLESFLEYIHQAERKGIDSIPAFIEKWRQDEGKCKAAAPEGIEAIRIMTIHKAKGLQAPIVLVPLHSSAFRLNPNKSGKRVRAQFGELQLNVRLLKLFRDEYEALQMREAHEILNLLYVAFTRPEKELHIFYPDGNEEDKKNCLMDRLLELAHFKAPLAIGQPWKGSGHNRPEAPVLEREAIPFVPGGTAAFPWVDRLKIARNKLFSDGNQAERRGTFMHFCLEHMRLTGNPEQDARNALNFGLSHSGVELSEEEAESVFEGLLWFASLEEARDWLAVGWPEHSLLDSQGKEKRIDLLVPQKRGALVVDYKSGQMSEEHIAQVRDYLRCLAESGDFGKNVFGLLLYLDQKKFMPVSLEGAGEASDNCPDMPFA